MKSNRVQSVQDFLVNDQIQEFEHILTKHFYNHSNKILLLDQVYTDWLRIGLRKIVSIQKSESPSNSLVNSYLRKDNFLSSFLVCFSYLWGKTT